MTFIISRAETNVLTLARVAVGVVPATDAMRLLVSGVSVPQKLGPTAREALSDTLSRGTVLSLARQGGWIPAADQRLWERTKVPKLEFTANIVRILNWVLATPLTEAEVQPLGLKGQLTVAEDAFVALLIDRLRGTGVEGAVARQPALRKGPLTVLAHAGLLGREAALESVPAIDVDAHATWIDGLRTLLARNWLHVEKIRRDITEPQVLTRIGRTQGDVLDAFFAIIHKAGRDDLATFVIDAATQWVTPDRKPDDFTRSMSVDAPLRERTEARRRSAAMVRALLTLREWDQEHRTVRFIDDGYDLAQRLVADWERLGERGFQRAQELVQELDAIPTLTPATN